MKKSNFKELVEKMEKLQETEEGKLKGGISTIDSTNLKEEDEDGTNYALCNGNGYCPGD